MKAMRGFLSLALILLLNACSSGSEYADIQQFMNQVKSEVNRGIAEIPATELYQPYSYGASNLRSPFVAPVVIPEKTEEEKANIGVRPPQNHIKQFLERFNIATISMVGTLEQDGATWGLVKDQNGGVHRVKTGDYMGRNWGKIESISDSRIDIIEIVSDGGEGWLRRPKSIELKN